MAVRVGGRFGRPVGGDGIRVEGPQIAVQLVVHRAAGAGQDHQHSGHGPGDQPPGAAAAVPFGAPGGGPPSAAAPAVGAGLPGGVPASGPGARPTALAGPAPARADRHGAVPGGPAGLGPAAGARRREPAGAVLGPLGPDRVVGPDAAVGASPPRRIRRAPVPLD